MGSVVPAASGAGKNGCVRQPVLANVGNAIYSVHVFQLPLGPIWFLHGYYALSSGLMLFWSRRFAPRDGSTCAHPPEEWAGRPMRSAEHAS